MIKRICFIMLILCWVVTASAQVKVRGKVSNSYGQGIEYVSIRVDSLYAVSDAEGNFELEVPKGHTDQMVVHHISYRTKQIPFESYKTGQLDIQLEEDVYELSDVVISNKKLKEKAVSHKGVKMPGDVSFRNTKYATYDIGPIIKNKRDYLIKSFNFKVEECTYTRCVLRIIVYEVKGKQFVPVQHKPIYLNFSDKQQFTEQTVDVKEEIILKKGHTYYIGVAVVDSNGKGIINFPAYLRSGYARNLNTKKTKKLPATLGISMKGLRW